MALVNDGRFQRAIQEDTGWHDGTYGYFAVVQGVSIQSHRMVVLARTDGRVLAAWRGPSPDDSGVCSVGDIGLGDGHAAFELKAWPDSSEPLESRIYHGPLSDIGTETEPLAVLDESFTLGSTIQNIAVSSMTVAADLAPGGFIAVAERGKLTRLDGDVPASASSPLAIIDGDVLFESWHPTTLHVMRGSVRKPAELYFGPPDTNLRHFVSDGADMAWLQVYGMESASGPYERAEIWTADYAQTPADMEPRNLAEVEPRVRGMIGGGVYALGAPGPDGELWLEFYDLADGRRRVLRPSPSEMRLRQLLYVSAEEFLVTAVLDGEVKALRIDLTTVPYE